MGVLVGVYHELDATFNSLLLTLTNSVEDLTNDGINAFLASFDDGLDHLMLDSLVLDVDLNSVRRMENGLIASLDDYGVGDLSDETSVGVIFLLLLYYMLFNVELRLGLLENLLLLRSDPLPLSFFLFSDLGLVLCNLILATLSAPTLSLLGLELVGPDVPTLTLNLDHCKSAINVDHHSCALVTLSLAADGLDDLDTVMADAVLLIHKVPELDLTAMTGLLGLELLGNLTRRCLLLTALLNSVGKGVLRFSFSSWSGSFVCRGGFSGGLGFISSVSSHTVCSFHNDLLGLFLVVGRNLRKVGSVDLCGLSGWDLNANISKHVVNGHTGRLLLSLRMRLSMSMMMRMSMVMMIGTSRPISAGLAFVSSEDSSSVGSATVEVRFTNEASLNDVGGLLLVLKGCGTVMLGLFLGSGVLVGVGKHVAECGSVSLLNGGHYSLIF